MTSEDFAAALEMYAESDQRAAAALIENITAAVLLKLNPPAHGEDVVSVSISPDDISETIRTHHFEAVYEGATMTLSLTPLSVPRE